MSNCFDLVVERRVEGEGICGEQVAWVVKIRPEDSGEVRRLLKERDKSIFSLPVVCAGVFRRIGRPSWAVVSFPRQYHLVGHILAIRAQRRDFTFGPGAQSTDNIPEPAADDNAPSFSFLYVLSKEALQKAALRSRLLEAAWEILKDRDESRHWLCFAGAPPENWAEKMEEKDFKKLLRVRRRWMPRDLHNMRKDPDFRATKTAMENDSDAVLLRHATALQEKHPYHPRAALILGEAYERLGLDKEAMSAWRRAIELYENDFTLDDCELLVESWVPMASVSDLFARNKRWANRYKRLMELYADAMESAATASVGIGVIHEKAGNNVEALKALQKALEISPVSRPALARIREIYNEMELYDEATAAAERLSRLAPDNPAVWEWYGHDLMMSKRFREAANAFERHCQMDKQSAIGWMGLGMAYFELCREERNSPQISFRFAGTMLLERASKAFRRALKIQPEQPDLLCQLGLTECKLGRFSRAARIFKKLIDIRPELSQVWNNYGFALANMKRYKEAIYYCKQALKLNPKNACAWDTLGLAYSESGNYPRAIGALQKSLSLNPEYPEAIFNLALTHRRIGQTEEYKRLAEQLSSLLPALACDLRRHA